MIIIMVPKFGSGRHSLVQFLWIIVSCHAYYVLHGCPTVLEAKVNIFSSRGCTVPTMTMECRGPPRYHWMIWRTDRYTMSLTATATILPTLATPTHRDSDVKPGRRAGGGGGGGGGGKKRIIV